MALYSTVLEYTVYGEVCQNRFHYASEAAGAVAVGAAKINQTFQLDVLPEIADLMSSLGSNISLDRLYTVNLYDETDFNEDNSLSPAVPPNDHGEVAPTFLALSFTSQRYRVGKNRWYKRIAGLGEGDIDGNEWGNSTTAIAAGTAMTTTLIHPSSEDPFDPVLLFLNPLSDPPYKLYDPETAQRAQMAFVTDVAYYGLTTQRSRKEGVGQ